MIGADLAAALPELQSHAESMMITPCRVRRPVDVTADPVTGADIPVYRTQPIHVGTCEVKTRDVQPVAAESASATAVVQRIEVKLPVGSGPYDVGDVVEILDGGRVSRRLRVVGLHLASWQTAQRLPVEEMP